MKYKATTGSVKAFDDDKLTVEHFISTEGKDRGGDIMLADGMMIDGEVVVLFQHGYDPLYGKMPIAKPLGFRPGVNKKGDKGIIATTQFPDDEDGRKLYNRIKSGYLKSWSIGYEPMAGEYSQLEGGGLLVKKWQLFEYSAVAVPMNADCTNLPEDVRKNLMACSYKAVKEEPAPVHETDKTPIPEEPIEQPLAPEPNSESAPDASIDAPIDATPDAPEAPIVPVVEGEVPADGEEKSINELKSEIASLKGMVEALVETIAQINTKLQEKPAVNPVTPEKNVADNTTPPAAKGLKFDFKKPQGTMTIADLKNLSDSIAAVQSANIKQLIDKLKGKVQ